MNALRILVVDDDKDFAESLAEALQLQGHHVDATYSGDSGILRFQQAHYDIAFMDVRMPGKDGVESFLEIKRAKPDARVVMMTGYSVEQLLDQAVNNGAWGILHKPLDMEQIRKMLKRIQMAGVLIADDDPDFVASIQEVLKENGYCVYCASDGRTAVERAREGGIDVLLLDLRLPVLSGLEVYLELRRTGNTIPIIIVTAFPTEEARAMDRLSSFDVSGILVKPFNTKTLLRTLESVTEAKRQTVPAQGGGRSP